MLSRSARRLTASLALSLFAAPLFADDPLTETASYTMTFQSQWNATNHPVDFPGAPAHFSALIGATHDTGASLWEPGGIATPGIEVMAESGGTSTLTQEINALIAGGTNVDKRLQGPALFGINNSVSMSFNVDADHSLVSLVTMIAPSPDWFVGVHGLSLIENGNWVQEISVPLLAYDAGTDAGASFGSPNANIPNHLPISLISGLAPLDGNFTPFGSFTFTRTDTAVWQDVGHALGGALGDPLLEGSGLLIEGESVELALSNALPGSTAALVLGLSVIDAPFKAGVLVPNPDRILFNLMVDGAGELSLPAIWPAGSLPGLTVAAQFWIQDAAGPVGWAASNASCTQTL